MVTKDTLFELQRSRQDKWGELDYQLKMLRVTKHLTKEEINNLRFLIIDFSDFKAEEKTAKTLLQMQEAAEEKTA